MLRHSHTGIPARGRWFRAIILALACALGILGPSPAKADDRVMIRTSDADLIQFYREYQAVVIGVENYRRSDGGRLKGAADDARRVAAALEELGFKTTLMIDPKAAELQTLLENLPDRQGSQRSTGLLFYFVGHGLSNPQPGGRKMGYLMPVNGPHRHAGPKDFRRWAVNTQELETMAYRIRCQHLLMVLDCDFEDSVFPEVKTGYKRLDRASTQTARQVIISRLRPPSPRSHHRFTNLFIQAIKGKADLNHDGNITGSELAAHLNYEASLSQGDFFNPKYAAIDNRAWNQGDFVISQAKHHKLAAQSASGNAQMQEEIERLKRELAQAKQKLAQKKEQKEQPLPFTATEKPAPSSAYTAQAPQPFGAKPSQSWGPPRTDILIAPAFLDLAQPVGQKDATLRNNLASMFMQVIGRDMKAQRIKAGDFEERGRLYDLIWEDCDFTSFGEQKPRPEMLARAATRYNADIVSTFWLRASWDSGYGEGQLHDVYLYLYCYVKSQDKVYSYYAHEAKVTYTPELLREMTLKLCEECAADLQ